VRVLRWNHFSHAKFAVAYRFLPFGAGSGNPSRVALLILLIATGCATDATNGSPGGYRLLVPPLNQAGYAATEQPLSKWQNLGNFGGKFDCTNFMETQQNTALAWYGRITQATNYNQTQAVEILSGRCVSIEDPGLKTQ